jgi:predicted nuclease with TOPRIM domain
MTKRNQSSRTRIPCEDLRSLGATVAETTTNVRLLSESQARTDQAISRLTEAMSTMAQHDGRLNHLEAEAARCHEHSTRLWQEVKDLRADTNKGIGLAETALERGKNQSFTLRQIIPWGTAIIMAGATVGLLLQG